MFHHVVNISTSVNTKLTSLNIYFKYLSNYTDYYTNKISHLLK